MNSWKSTGLWPVDQTKALSTVRATCNAETKPQSTYSRNVAVQDTFPINQIDARGLRKLAKDDIDITAFRTYTIVSRNLAKSPEAQKRSPNKTLIKVKTHHKRLLTHDDCMSIELQKAFERLEGKESKLMKKEDSARKMVEQEIRKLEKIKQREHTKELTRVRKEEESKRKKAETAAHRAVAKLNSAKRPRKRKSSTGTVASALPAVDVVAYADI